MAVSLPAHAQGLDELITLDARAGMVAERLLSANSPLCRSHAPLTGMVLHSRDQYKGDWADRLFVAGPLAVATVLPGSPAAEAGVQPGDTIISIGGEIPVTDGGTLREAGVALLAARWQPGTPLSVQVSRSGTAHQAGLYPVAGCDVTVEVTTDDGMAARTDGQIIQLGHRLVQAASDSDLAVILAHELGHVILRHRERLHAAHGGDKAPQKYRRHAEEEADRLSPYLVANSGLNPALVPDFWRSPLGRRVNRGLLRDRAYPPTSERVRQTQVEATALAAGRLPVPPDLLASRDQAIITDD
ncbi:M48 family metallopeptidase [Croceibacterium sp. TMG7-5b_MA50]|uniref:M48 family metallopeptidase n=1 Tax=Croceibacterium sp. TMG7-5b_MA50 TaxID=3121290 RepID=UPI0032220BDB